jgi:lipopolysaccharide heptosyltransferase II
MQRQVNTTAKWLDLVSGWTFGAALGALARLTGVFGRSVLASTPREILIVKFCCMGDAVLVLPALRALKESFPDARVSMLCTPRTLGIFRDCPHLDEVQVFQLTGSRGIGEFLTSGLAAFFAVLGRLRARRFDLVIDFDNYYNWTTFIGFFSGAPTRIGFDPPGQGRRFLLTHPVPYAGDRHMVEFYLDLVRAAGVVPVHKAPEIPVDEVSRAWAGRFLAEGGFATDGRPLVALSPGRSEAWHFIRWSEENFAATGEAVHRTFGARVLLVGGPAEIAIAERMSSVLAQRGVPVLSAVGKTTLLQSEALMQACDLLVCNDSGPMHLSAAVGTPTLAVFGPANHLRWGPYGPEHRVVRLDLDCSPCLFMGRLGVCPRQELECLGVPSARVIAVAGEMLQARSGRPGPERIR